MNEGRQRRTRDRAATERELLDAAWKLFEREGVLAGLNLNAVADEAGLNRAQIYHYFGSREGLLRRALQQRLEELQPLWREDRRVPFVQRRRHAFDVVAEREPVLLKLVALLALEGVEPLGALANLEETRETYQHDIERGVLPEDADTDLIHVVSMAAYVGYGLLRATVAEELGTPVEELDRRAGAVFEAMVRGLTAECAPRRAAKSNGRR
jgi:AcrR family transcriptional regulator